MPLRENCPTASVSQRQTGGLIKPGLAGFKQTQFRLGQQKLHPHKLKPPTLAKHGSTPLTPTLTDRDDSAPLQRASWAYSPQLH